MKFLHFILIFDGYFHWVYNSWLTDFFKAFCRWHSIFLLPPFFSNEKSTVTYIIVLLYALCPLLSLFNIFLLISGFLQFYYNVPSGASFVKIMLFGIQYLLIKNYPNWDTYFWFLNCIWKMFCYVFNILFLFPIPFSI